MICPHCGGKKSAEDLKVPYPGAFPLDPGMVEAMDERRLFIIRHADSLTRKAVDTVMKNLVHQI